MNLVQSIRRRELGLAIADAKQIVVEDVVMSEANKGLVQIMIVLDGKAMVCEFCSRAKDEEDVLMELGLAGKSSGDDQIVARDTLAVSGVDPCIGQKRYDPKDRSINFIGRRD